MLNIVIIMKKIFLLFISLLISNSWAQIFVSTSGADNNPGTIDLPLKTIPAAVTLSQPGDTIFVRGGIFILSTTITISKIGTANNRYYMFAYQDERPVLDFTSQPFGSSQRGINLYGSYWHIKGIDIYGAGDNGMFIRGSFNIIEYCAFYENRDTGLQLGNGASHNNVINCDSYFNADPGQGNADGFAAKLDVGTGNYFYGCRAWQNSDDGWDGYLRGADNITTVVENSWCFMNGYLKDGTMSTGNGNGYKMGGGDNTNSANLANDFTIINSLAFDNRVKGYDQNNNRGSMTLYNCSAYRNGINYSIPGFINAGEIAAISNCSVLGSVGSLASHVVQQTNSWLPPFTVTNADFISIDTIGVRSSRKEDGSLPDINFMHLAEGSDLIDAGTPVGLPYNDAAPDLGAFETDGVPSSIEDKNEIVNHFSLQQNYPNPFNPTTKFFFNILSAGKVRLDIYDILGNKIAQLYDDNLNSGHYEIIWNAHDKSGKLLPSGIYFATLHFEDKSQTIKLVLLK
jgi:hypothetical protein